MNRHEMCQELALIDVILRFSGNLCIAIHSNINGYDVTGNLEDAA